VDTGGGVMEGELDQMAAAAAPTRARPLLGLTVLVVEDSRYASEALRLMCLRSGARIRRADCIASAKRHLNVYRPSVAIIDLGLPDGSGLDLIRTMRARRRACPSCWAHRARSGRHRPLPAPRRARMVSCPSR
jgi:PleD family two-component response regulator